MCTENFQTPYSPPSHAWSSREVQRHPSPTKRWSLGNGSPGTPSSRPPPFPGRNTPGKSWQPCYIPRVTCHLPGSLRLEEKFLKCDFWASSVSSRTHQVGWVNEVDTRFGSTLSCLDVVARCADMVSPREVISLSCLLSGWRVQGMLRAGRISPVEISKKSIRSVGLRKKKKAFACFPLGSGKIWNFTWRAVLPLLTLNSSLNTVRTADLSW